MAQQCRKRGRHSKINPKFGFGALDVAAVAFKDIGETWGNPNLDCKPLNSHTEPMKTAKSLRYQKLSSAYPHFKYSKPKRRRRKKKKQNLRYFHPQNGSIPHSDLGTHPPPKKLMTPHSQSEYKRSIRPSSATLIPQTPRGDQLNDGRTRAISQDAESIQLELMRQHLEGMDVLKQEIASQMKRNLSHNQLDTFRSIQQSLQNAPSNTERDHEQEVVTKSNLKMFQNEKQKTKTTKSSKSLSKQKKEIFVPETPRVAVLVGDEGRIFPQNLNLKNAVLGSPQRPRHQSFQQRPPDSGGSRPIFDVVMTKRKKKKLSPRHKAIAQNLMGRTPRTPRTSTNSSHSKHKKKSGRRKRVNRKSHYQAHQQFVYQSHRYRPSSKQSKLHQVMVGDQPIVIEDRFSSTFASNTPRITALQKLYDNPEYKKYSQYQTLAKAASSNSKRKKKGKNKKSKRKRPWSHRKSIKSKQKNNKTTKSKRKRPQSAPARSNGPRPERWDIKQYLKSNETMDDDPELQRQDTFDWNPFDGITMFELQYLVSFLRSQQELYQISNETLDVLDKCLHFYVSNDSYETAWNAWNIIQRFLLPDNSQLDIDKNLCRQVLGEYQTQSRDLKHNHINEALFDDVIQEIGLKIAVTIPDRQEFTINFEKYVIQIQQSSHLENAERTEPPQLGQRPQSAMGSNTNTKDLVHRGMTNRPQSALPGSDVRSTVEGPQIENIEGGNTIDIENVDEEEDSNEEPMKYCLDGIIDEM